MLFQQSKMKQCSQEIAILLQRYSFNSELLANPGTQVG